MAIGLDNVNNRKVKRSSVKNSPNAPAEAPAPAIAAPTKPSSSSGDAWSTRGLAREGRSAQRERKTVAGDLNILWLEWTSCTTGSETPNRLLRTIRQVLDLENFVFDFLVYDLQIPARAKKRILGIRSRSARALQIRKLLARH